MNKEEWIKWDYIHLLGINNYKKHDEDSFNDPKSLLPGSIAMCQQQWLRSDIQHSQTISYHKFGSSSLAALGSLLASEYAIFFGKTLKICWWNPDFGVEKIWRNPTGALVRFGTYLVSSPIIGGNHPHSITPTGAVRETHCTCWPTLGAWSRWGLLPGKIWEVGSNGPAFIHNRICIYAYNVCINDIYIIQLLHCYNKDYFLQLVFFPGSETLQFGGAECFKLKPYWTRIPLQLDQKESSFDATSHRPVSTHLIIGDHHPIFLVGN